MQFLFQPLTWGFLLAAVPILIHLINMLRHRRQAWAAMDFLLESYRRNRRWVMLKQWLLLAARILAMLLLVAMLAKWVSSSQLLSWLGSRTTHHYVLLDDSYSMAAVAGSSNEGNETAYNRGLKAIRGLLRSISSRPGQHQLTLIRLSRTKLATNETDSQIDSIADLSAVSIPRDPQRLLDRLTASEPSALALEPDATIELVSSALTERTEEQAEIYLVSDLRENQFAEPESLKNRLSSVVSENAALHIIDCGQEAANNLSISAVTPEQDVWASGVPLMVRFQVRNQGLQTAKNVVAQVRTVAYPQGATSPQLDEAYSGEITELPPVVIESIEPGKTVTRQVQVIFGVPGSHVVEISLANDSLSVDNRRWCVVSMKQQQQILLVDGDPRDANAFYLESVINPDRRLQTGMSFEKADAAFLRDLTPEELAANDTVCLLDVPRLDPEAVNKLRDYVADGGGLLIVCGENTNRKFVNEQLAAGTDPLFPAQVNEIVLETNVTPGERQPLVKATEHPVLAPLTMLSNSPFFLLQIRKQLELLEAENSSFEVVATNANDQPLIVDHGIGKGRVLIMLTGLSGQWSNWAQDPTFVVLALRSLGYLSSFRREPTEQSVSSPLEMVVTGRSILANGEVIFPARENASRLQLQREVAFNENGNVATLSLDVDLQNFDRAIVDAFVRPGIFETWMVDGQGEASVRTFAHNPNPAEGNLTRVTAAELKNKLSGVEFDLRSADSLIDVGLESSDASQSMLLMGLLVLLMLGEQALAYSASYHAPRGKTVVSGLGGKP